MTVNHYLSLSDINILGSLKINPHCAQSMERTFILCSNYKITRPDMHRYISMSSYLFPYADYERLLTIDLLNAVLFYIDDVYDRNNKDIQTDNDQINEDVFKECVRIFVSGRLPTTHHDLYPIWQEVHRRFMEQSHLTYMQRLIASLSEHFHAITIPNEAFSEVNDQNIQRYIAARVHDSGMYPTMVLIEFAAGIDINPRVRNHPFIQRATYLTAVIAALLNDLFSYEKEVLQLDSHFNIVRILMDLHHLSFVESVHKCVLMINSLTSEFCSIEASRPNFGYPQLNHQADVYLNGLRDQLIAAWHWQLSTNRYRSSKSPFPMLRELISESSLESSNWAFTQLAPKRCSEQMSA